MVNVAGRPTHAVVDMQAFKRNVARFCSHAAGALVMAVVKADAYGHGAVPMARAALEAGASCLAVATVGEGVHLREAGISGRILVIGPVEPEEADAVVAFGLAVSLSDDRLGGALHTAAQRRGTSVSYHLKVDTGLHRLGVAPGAVQAFTERLLRFPALQMEGIYTHFSAADYGDEDLTREQLHLLTEAAAAARRAGAPPRLLRHAAGSYAAIRWTDTHLDMIRPGIALFGYHPAPELRELMPLEPVLSLYSVVSQLRTLAPGTPVGYGGKWVAGRETLLATLPIGLGDGYPRSLAGRGTALVRGRRCPVVGSVALDACTVDVTDVASVACGDVAGLIGKQGDESIWADEVAAAAGTIVDDVLSRLAPRVPRAYTHQSSINNEEGLNRG